MSFLFIFTLFSYFGLFQSQQVIYSCINCSLTEWIPFGDKSLVVYLNPSDANRSKMILLDEKNLGIDTISGFLQGFEKIIKTSDSTFTTFGQTSIKGKLIKNNIVLDSAFTVKFAKKLNQTKYDFTAGTVISSDYAHVEFLRQIKNEIETQLFKVPISDIKGQKDQVMASNNYYGNKIPKESMFLLSGKLKTQPILKEISKPHSGGNLGSLVLFDPDEGMIYFKRNSQKFFSLKQDITLNNKSLSEEIIRPIIDLKTGKKYLIVKVEKDSTLELWEINNYSLSKINKISKLTQTPYHIENGLIYFKTETALGTTIYTEKI